MADKITLVDVYNRPWSYDDIEYWRNPNDGAINAVIEFEGQRTRLRSGILIVNGDKVLLSREKGQEGEFSLPGGGLDKDETPVDAAIREAQEEVHFNVKNARETGFDYCEVHTEPVNWVKRNVPENKRWINYYTCLIIADYASSYNGEVDDVDKDDFMEDNKRWYKIKDVVNMPTFKKQWKRALTECGYYQETFTEQLNQFPDVFDEDLKDKAKEYFGTTNRWKLAFYMNTDGTWLDGSGKKLGSSGYDRAVDHREISDIFDISITGDESMLTYMREGNIRLKPEAPGFELIEEPTEEQYQSLQRLISYYTDTYYVDVDDDHGWSMWSAEMKPTPGHAARTINGLRRYFKARNASVARESLTEDTRSALVNKSRGKGDYKDQSKGRNRFERRNLSKIANTVKSYNKINTNNLFKQDELKVQIPVIGETDTYLVTAKMNGVIAEMAKNIKSNNNKLEYRTVIQALTKVFNTTDVYINCTCPDHLYNFAHWNIINNVSSEDTAHDPGPGKNVRNPNDDKGRGCKHTLLILANGDWMMKVASVINNYIHYAEEHFKEPFLKVIFPKLYGIPADEMVDADLIDDEKFLESPEGLIDAINEYGKNRGKYKPGSNKNPVTGTGGRNKPADADEEEEPTNEVEEPTVDDSEETENNE